MISCPYCYKENSDLAKYCKFCGSFIFDVKKEESTDYDYSDNEYTQSEDFNNQTDYDNYQILGCSASDNSETIKKAYRKLVQQFHPDKNNDKTDKERNRLEKEFIKVQQAYEEIKLQRGFR